MPYGASLIRACLPWHLPVTRTCFSAAVWRIVIRRWHDGSCNSLNHIARPIPVFYIMHVFVCICMCMGGNACILVADIAPAVFDLIGDFQLDCICLSPCWLPRINLLLLTSVASSCQNEKKSFPLLYSSSLSKPWHFPAFLKSFHASVDKLDQPIG